MRGGLPAKESHSIHSARPARPQPAARPGGSILLPVTTEPPGTPAEGGTRPGRTLRLGRREWPPGTFAIMAVINRTPDSFFDQGATYPLDAAVAAADRAVAAGAGILDIGGVKAGPGEDVPEAEEIRRVAGLVGVLAERHPRVVISVDTWRAPVAEAVARAGAHLINDAWGGADPRLAEVAARRDLGLVCAHAGGLAPRTRPHRPAYADLVSEVRAYVTGEAERAVAAGVRPDRIIIDPAHDFGKNTWHSLELTRRTADLVATGWPVLIAVSNKDFVGETLGLPVTERGEGTLAALAVCAWQGARVFRVHDAAAARQALAAVTALRAGASAGPTPPGASRRRTRRT
jgi:dihydropteroate synthase